MPKNYIQDVGFYAPEQQEIARRQKLAELMMQQGQTPFGPTENIGGWAVKRSPMEGIGKMAQALSGSYQQNQVDERRRALAEKMRTDRSQDYQALMGAQMGTPAEMPNAERAEFELGTPATPPTGITPALLAQLRSPEVQALAGQQLTKQMETQRLIDALKKSGVGGQGQPPSAPGQPGQLPGVQTGLPPIELLGAGDMGKTVFSALNTNQNAGNRVAMDQAQLQQKIAEFNGLSAYQKAQLGNQGINTAIDYAKAVDAGIIPRGQPPQIPGQPPAGMPMPPQMAPSPPQRPPMPPPTDFPRVTPQQQSQRDVQARNIDAGMTPSGAGPAIPSESVLSPKQTRDLAQQRAEVPIKAGEAFQTSLAGESGKQYAKIIEDSGKVSTQADLGRRALDQYLRYSKHSPGGTGPFATLGGMTQYTSADTQALNNTFKDINMKNLVATFQGMSRAIDTQAERAAWEATQPSLINDEKANVQILVGSMSLAAKTAAEGQARREYMDQRQSLQGYSSPIIGKVDVMFDQQGNTQIVPKGQKSQGLMTDREYIQRLLSGGQSGATGGWRVVR